MRAPPACGRTPRGSSPGSRPAAPLHTAPPPGAVIRNNFILPIQTIIWDGNPCFAGITRAFTRCPHLPPFFQLLPAISSNTVKMLIG